MIYEILHHMEYRYSAPVYLEPHLLHLLPRSDVFQHVQRFSLRVQPEPVRITQITDALGNPAHEIWFGGLTDKLILESSSRVEITRRNPFDFILREGSLRLPVKYSPQAAAMLQPYLSGKKQDTNVVEFAASAANRAGQEIVPFLSELCGQIYRHMKHANREGDTHWSPEKILAEGTGACRDLAIFFIACCRSQGLAARFTSGYAQELSNAPEDRDELHAWAEVYLEGAGWRGYDPTEGLVVGDRHVALASAPDPQPVTPVLGTFRSNTATAKLSTHMRIQPVAEKSLS